MSFLCVLKKFVFFDITTYKCILYLVTVDAWVGAWRKWCSSWTVSIELASLYFVSFQNCDNCRAHFIIPELVSSQCAVTTGERLHQRQGNRDKQRISDSESATNITEVVIIQWHLHEYCSVKGRWGCNKHVGLFYQFSVKCVLISVMHWHSREEWVVTQSQVISDHHKSFLLGQKVMRNWDDDGEVPQVSYHFTQPSTCSAWSLKKTSLRCVL